ncbi:MAG: insulinase family protein [Myxococcaceae bacterium]|nr:insulinase family protein [Myxococcaceae bacterium]
MIALALVLAATADAGLKPGLAAHAPEPVAARAFAATTPLQLLTLPSKTPIVSIRLVFKAGSVDDPKGKEGLTALTTRLILEGGTEKLTGAQLREALFPMAGQIGGDTDKDLTAFAGRVHQEKLDAFLALFSDVLLHPRFDPKELERLRDSALNTVQVRLRQENDEELGKVSLDALLYAGHPYRHAVVGTAQGLKAITLDDVKAQAAKLFSQDRAVLGIAGPVDEALSAKVVAAFQGLPAKGAPVTELPKASGIHGQSVIVQRDTLSTAGSFGFTWNLRRGDPDFFAVALALSYLGEHRQQHGVLFDELREKRGLNYGTYSYPEHFRQEGGSMLPMVNSLRRQQDMTVWLRPVEPQNGAFATRGATYFVNALLTQPMPKDRFETARGFLIGATRLREQKDQRRLGQAIDDLLSGTPGFYEQFRAALEKLTPEQVQAAAKKVLSIDRLNYVFVTKDADALKAAITSAGPNPISYPSPKPKDVLDLDPALASQPLPITSVTVLPASGVMEQ